ncbi:MAG: phosphatase PAP2 family protein [Salibacteraceae bacterium]
MFRIIKKYAGFFIPYLVFLVFGAYFLLSFNRIDTHIICNQFVQEKLNPFFIYSTYLGDGNAILIVAIALLFFSFKHAIYVGMAGAFSGSITGLLKNYAFDDVHRPHYMFKFFVDRYDLNLVLPPAEMHIHNSFPSGHTTGAFCLMVALMLVLNKPKLAILFFLVALIGGLSRVYLSQHFFVDIYFGSMVGTFGALTIWKLFAFLDSKYSVTWWNKSLIKFK